MNEDIISRIIDGTDWTATRDANGTITMLEAYSPAGEDIVIETVEGQDIRQAVHETASHYDPDTHARDLIVNPMNGQTITTVRDIIDDAEQIGSMLHELDEKTNPARPNRDDPLCFTTKECDELRDEVTGYITAYWQQANDGHPYYAAQHHGETTRSMARSYMTERYADYLAEIEDRQPEYLWKLANQSPMPVDETQPAVAMTMDAFDAMFDRLWPID